MYRQLRNALIRRWSAEGGYREVLVIALPLIISTGSWSIQHFIDRMFLTWYSPAAIAAAMPAGMLHFTMLTIFMGTVSYVDTFIAQYYGANMRHRIGPVMWQALYVSLAGAALIACAAPFSEQIFAAVGHPAEVQANEVIFFRTFCYGSLFPLAAAVFAGFYAGRGNTGTVMGVNLAGMAVNIVLDYGLIFGNLGLPRWGMYGAAVATIMSSVTDCLLFAVLLLREEERAAYRFTRMKIDGDLLRRLVRYGCPSGIQFFLDIAGFTVFIMLMGSLGTTALAASNIAFNINTLVFMPMLGTGIAVSILVGQSLGKDRPAAAEQATWSAFHIAFLYMAGVAALFVIAPRMFIAPFAARSSFAGMGPMEHTVTLLLRFVALYSLFDAANMVFAAAIKGAGDTWFVMKTLAIASVGVLIVPLVLALKVCGGGLIASWSIATLYAATLGIAFYLRFGTGTWKAMRVIERVVTPVVRLPEACSKDIC